MTENSKLERIWCAIDGAHGTEEDSTRETSASNECGIQNVFSLNGKPRRPNEN